MAGGVEITDGVGDVGGFGFGEFAERSELGVDIAVEVKQTISRFPLAEIRNFFCKCRQRFVRHQEQESDQVRLAELQEVLCLGFRLEHSKRHARTPKGRMLVKQF